MDWHAYRAVLYDTTYRVLSIRVEMCEHIYNLCQLLGTACIRSFAARLFTRVWACLVFFMLFMQ